MEKFENYISINNINNFGKSQNVYSANLFNTKKEVFGENDEKDKVNKGKNKDDNDNKKIKMIIKKIIIKLIIKKMIK